MTTIIRRYRRRRPAAHLPGLAVLILAVVLAGWALLAIWSKGGPQPVHSIVIAIPAPQMPVHAATGRPA